MTSLAQKLGNIKEHRDILHANGYNVIPVKTGAKIPTESNWQVPKPPGPVNAASLNTGILTSGLRVVDIDCNNAVDAQAISDLARAILGDAPKRTRNNSPRVLLPFRAAEGTPRKRRIEGEGHTVENSRAVEILGDGQQFVAFGEHPSGAAYEWTRAPGKLLPLVDLTAVTEEQISEFLDQAAKILNSSGETRPFTHGGRNTPPQTDLKAEDIATLTAIIRQLPNKLSRDEWLKVAHAIAAAFADDKLLGRELFLEFSLKYPGADEYEAERVWDTLNGLHKTGHEYIINLAGKAGIDTAPYMLKWAQNAFVAEPVPPGGIPQHLYDLYVNRSNLPETAEKLRDIFARKGRFYERGGLKKLVFDPMEGGTIAEAVTPQTIIREAHRVSIPFSLNNDRKRQNITLPQSVAQFYEDMHGEWNLPVLNGITSAPILKDDGSIRSEKGYDVETGLYCEGTLDVSANVPEEPSKAEAHMALAILRDALKTFPFADAHMGVMGVCAPIQESKYTPLSSEPVASGINPGETDDSSYPHHPHVPIAHDESAALVALLTAVCRASIPLAPGVLITAPGISGAGVGKGLLARVINQIAFGRAPQAFTGGADQAELEKRIAAELMGAAPALLLDNLNGISLRSDLLASALTERPARVRLLGQSKMVLLNSSALVMLTGNGLSVSEDLARRFIRIELDAKIEDPESRSFESDLLANIRNRRTELLIAALTIWRWGRQRALTRGKPLGSFSEWCAWVRDPLLALGCSDPVERIAATKTADPRRGMAGEFFRAWIEAHGDGALKVSAVSADVMHIIDPANRGLQYRSRAVAKLLNTRVEGLTLVCSKTTGKHGAAYAVVRTDGIPTAEPAVCIFKLDPALLSRI